MVVTPSVIFFVFVPTLVFNSAFSLDARALRENLAPTLTLAIPGLLLSTAVIGGILHWSIPLFGVRLTWPEALLLGSILSATEPVAVVSVFARLGAPKRLSVLVEGESLFNDATAIALSRVLLGIMGTGVVGNALWHGLTEFLLVFAGGVLVGWVLALAAGLVLGAVHGDTLVEITITTILAYLAFYAAGRSRPRLARHPDVHHRAGGALLPPRSAHAVGSAGQVGSADRRPAARPGRDPRPSGWRTLQPKGGVGDGAADSRGARAGAGCLGTPSCRRTRSR